MTEAVSFPIDIDADALLEYYNSLPDINFDDSLVNHKEEWVATGGMDFSGDTVSDFSRSGIGVTKARVNPGRLGRVTISVCDKEHPLIKELIVDIQRRIEGAEIGAVDFFWHHSNHTIPLHNDWPIRKNSVLVIPIFSGPYTVNRAVSYFEGGGELNLVIPTILNIMLMHGVRNIDRNRLCLHIEIPNLPTEMINERISLGYLRSLGE